MPAAPSSPQPPEPNSHTWCYITKFVCAFESLPAAKRRYQEVVGLTREYYDVLLASEQAYNLGQSEPIFSLLLDELIGFGPDLPEAEKETYSVFIFTTIVDVPEETEDTVAEVAAGLELDDENDFPAVFPSRTRSIRMSQTGHETASCISQ